jgi:hypothetical protein
MAAEARQGVRPSLVIALGAAVIALLVWWQWPSASPSTPTSNPIPGAAVRGTAGANPASLEVRIAKLKTPAPAPDKMERNPFRFEPKTAPPPAGPPPSFAGVPGAGQRGTPPPPAAPAGPPPIPLKFIGRLDSPSTGVIALFSDTHGLRPRGREGDIILGQYRILHIGVESVVLEYLDGSGRQTIPLTGQGGS